ncbi:glycosyltransferase family 4 protein [Hydrogenophaga borbori]|jgi:glycosyltransferase involved in cell wall biosynthesis|uniref:glycosyltransferase family 4 protein n=1 Tax=Hydrogenophaga borbori TaxID=2294117 RepID=UPI00301CB884
MRILVVGGMYPPMRTGTAFYTQNLATELQRQGHAVEIVTLGASPSHAVEDGLSVHRLPAWRLPLAGFFKHYQLCAPNPLNWWRLARIARRFQADAVLLVNHYLDIAFPAAFAAWRVRAPLVCSVGTQLQSLNPRRDRLLNRLDRLICGRGVFPFCDAVVAWDTQIRQYLSDVQGERVLRKTHIVNYGVAGDSAALAQHSNDHAYRGLILGVGAVSEQRSFVPLVKAFAELAPEFPTLKLRIVGHVYYDEAPRLADSLGLGERVEFLGERPHDEVLTHMQAADLLFSSLTGRYVGMGTATIEAMLLAVPTVVNTPLDLLGTATLVDGEHLVQCTDPAPSAIAQRLRALLGDESLRRRVGTGGRRFVQEQMNWPKVARDMASLLKGLVQRQGRS